MADTSQLQSIARKAVAAVIGFILAMVLLVVLLIAGSYLLVHALILGLTPWLGQAGAMALAGVLCLLLLVGVLYRLTRQRPSGKRQKTSDGRASPVDSLRKLIRENPLEATLMAFAAGIAEQGDPRLKSLLLQGGMVLMKQGEQGWENRENPGNTEGAQGSSEAQDPRSSTGNGPASGH